MKRVYTFVLAAGLIVAAAVTLLSISGGASFAEPSAPSNPGCNSQ